MSDESPASKPPESGKPAAIPPVEAKPMPAPVKKAGGKKLIGIMAAVVVLAFVIYLVISSLGVVSTDDAYVNSHVTFVAPRVAGQVKRVLVDDNNRVRKGDVLVQLDEEPFLVQVHLKEAAVAIAQADLSAANASVRGMIGQIRSARFKLEYTIDQVHNDIELVKANVAALNSANASLTLAQQEFDRSKKLLATHVASNEEFDQRQEELTRAQAQYSQALQNVYQSRVALGLPVKPENSDDLTQVPSDLDQTAPAVRQAQAELIQSAAQLNVTISSYKLTPREMIDEFYNRDPQRDIDRIYDSLTKEAPPIKQAEAKLQSARSDLDQANLNLRYCTVVAEIDGVITRRNVNPGNDVQVAQQLMAIRSLKDIWVDANFKETQLADLRIGQPVDLETDVYGSRKIYKGRISGFTMGTGSTLALLPAQNATGNFVKVVQRLPVRIDVLDYDPDKDPLFVGISVTPKVHIKAQPTGPNAGDFLQMYIPVAESPSTPAIPTPAASPATSQP